jgi:hypothetical protein
LSSDSPTPGEPAGGESTPGRAVGGLERAALEAARLELEASQRQIAELEELLSDLPTLFEHKFSQRIEPLLERQRLLLEAFDDDAAAAARYGQAAVDTVRAWQDRLFPVLMTGI